MIPGLFITGTDTNVGKTYVAALIARRLAAAGRRVGVYKPAASGCSWRGETLVSDDAVALWEAAGRPGELDRVAPQRFAASLAPHLAARQAGQSLDAALLRTGLDYWLDRSDVVLVEGAGGLLSPLGEKESVADLARDLGYPLVVVVRNCLGMIHQTLATLAAAASFGGGLPVAGVVLNHTSMPDESAATNRRELAGRTAAPILAEVAWQAADLGGPLDWYGLAHGSRSHS